VSLARLSAVAPNALGANADTPEAAITRLDCKWDHQLRYDARRSRRTEAQNVARSPAPKLKREIAALLEVCIILGGGDGVLAHIRDLKDVSSVPPPKEIDRAARWVKRKLAERRQSE
jgi:hypothetical protein